LSDELFLISNVSDLETDCSSAAKNINLAVNKITVTQSQFLLTIKCGCTARTLNLELPTGLAYCSEDIKTVALSLLQVITGSRL